MLQLDFHREAHNLRRFAANFASPFWSALVSFPQVTDLPAYLLPDVL
jgi:predicted unusual protein kinase regulating ubiquinone biosynthesis (AarF/ABC1/UbiB family)